MPRITPGEVVLGCCLSLPGVLTAVRPTDHSRPTSAIGPCAGRTVRSVFLNRIGPRQKPKAKRIPPVRPQAAGRRAVPTSPAPGVYLRIEAQYVYVESEALTWRFGYFSSNERTAMAHLTARAAGPRSGLQITPPVDFLVIFPEGAGYSEFQLLIADAKKDRRDFRLELTWEEEDSVSWGGTNRNIFTPNIEEDLEGNLNVRVSPLPPGEYGLLLPSFLSNTGLPAEKIYTFRVSADSQAPRPQAAAPTVGATTNKPGVYAESPDGYIEIESEEFAWHAQSPWWRMAQASAEYQRFVRWERINGRLLVTDGETVVPRGAKFLIRSAPGTDLGDYRLVSIDSQAGERKVRLDAFFVNEDSYLGFGLLALSPGREPIAFESEKLGAGRYRVTLPDLKRGQYGFLGPGIAGHGQTGTIHAFELR